MTMQRAAAPGHPRPFTADDPDPLTPPTHYLFHDTKKRRAPPQHSRIPSLLLNQFSSFETLGSPPPTYSSQPPPPSPPGAIIDLDESDQTDSDTDSDDGRSLSRDGGKAILIERLSHIIRHLHITTESGDMVDELHSKVDEMYGVMGKFLCFDGHTTSDGDIFGPLSHTTQTKPITGWTLPTPFRHEEEDEPPTPPPKDITPLLTAEIASLNTQLSTVLQSLRTRKEETDQIQSLLLSHLQTAATHICTLESTIVSLESDRRASDASLRHLRLELRAVETLWRSSSGSCGDLTRSVGSSPAAFSPRTPGTVGGGTVGMVGTVDVELVQSIENWKADWRELRERVAARRGDEGGGKRRRIGRGEVGVDGEESVAGGVGATPTRRGLRGSVLGSPAAGVAATGRLRDGASVFGSPAAGARSGRFRGEGSVLGSPAGGGGAMGRLRDGASVFESPYRRTVGSPF
ncbi:hypothetical protein QBC39DRAFT_173744 [Podospora conica]|nr:hypothetical protein QBC39DRAFT_173744 [Schizothecium conicum]